jgi:hypothetical protein
MSPKFSISSIDYPSTLLANSDTNSIIFRNVEIYKNYFFRTKKNYCEG